MVHRYWPVSEIYRIVDQIGTASGTVLTALIYSLIVYLILISPITFFFFSLQNKKNEADKNDNWHKIKKTKYSSKFSELFSPIYYIMIYKIS